MTDSHLDRQIGHSETPPLSRCALEGGQVWPSPPTACILRLSQPGTLVDLGVPYRTRREPLVGLASARLREAA
jgi:hypothetical protein